MKIHIVQPKKHPPARVGQIRETKAHGKQVRVRERASGMQVTRNGRPAYEWVALTPENVAAHRLEHLDLFNKVPNEL
jgi:hypothetical protein